MLTIFTPLAARHSAGMLILVRILEGLGQVSTKCEIRQFHVVVVQRRQRNVQKSVMHVQRCFACLLKTY